MEKIILIDTHRCFKILEGAKMPTKQAEAIVKVLSEGITADKLVTKIDLIMLESRLTIKLTAIMFTACGLLFTLLKLT